MSINWRASLVPAAAVIPAPMAYTNTVAVKKLVVGFRDRGCKWAPYCAPRCTVRGDQPLAASLVSSYTEAVPRPKPPSLGGGGTSAHTTRLWGVRGCYCEQNSVFNAGVFRLCAAACMFKHGMTRDRPWGRTSCRFSRLRWAT